MWNVASICTALATSFATLLWPRMLFGVLSSALDPVALKLCATYFPTYHRAFAIGLFMSCLYIGAAISSISLLIAQSIGWRLTYLYVGLLGALITLVVGPFIRNSKQVSPRELGYQQVAASEAEAEVTQSLWDDLKELIKNKTLIIIPVIGFFRFAGTYARTFFEPEFFARKYPDMKAVYSVCNAAIVVLTCLGPIIGGYYTDKHEQANPRVRPIVCW